MNVNRRVVAASLGGIAFGALAPLVAATGLSFPVGDDSPVGWHSPAWECDDRMGVVASLLPVNALGVEDGLDALPRVVSPLVHERVEPLAFGLDAALDTWWLLGTTLENEVHVANCRAVVPVEDLVDDVLG